MLTRGGVTRQYGEHAAGDYPSPPFRALMPHHQHEPRQDRAQLYAGGGLLGAGVPALTARGWTGSVLGNTGYGYLGMDPSAPSTWPRPFVPSRGMIGRLHEAGGPQ